MQDIDSLLLWAEAALQHIPNSSQEARWLLEYVLAGNLLTAKITAGKIAYFQALVKMRQNKFPLAYITGEQPFFGLSFKVTPAVLIPRQDTELLVELALQRLAAESKVSVLELGTGSGAIACAIAKNRPNAQVIAVDNSIASLQIARKNIQALNLANVELLHSNWFASVEGNYNLIVSNPPYIANNSVALCEDSLVYEPQAALVAAENGFAAYKTIINHAKNYLKSSGSLLLEHGDEQQTEIISLLQQEKFSNIVPHRDCHANWRAISAEVK